MSSLTEHRKTHTGIKNYACGKCDMHFAYKSNVLKHVRNTHSVPKNGKDVCADRQKTE